MSAIVRRSCNSSNRVDDDRIVFNSFIIELSNDHARAFGDIHRYLHDDEGFDRVLMARTLEAIIDEGIYALMHQVYDETECHETIPEKMI